MLAGDNSETKPDNLPLAQKKGKLYSILFQLYSWGEEKGTIYFFKKDVSFAGYHVHLFCPSSRSCLS